MPQRLLDHLVLPTGDLSVARSRMMALGFTVAPTGTHPFGTANCCIYVADGTFIEPLAIADHSLIQRAIDDGNVFVARDAQFRMLAGDNGFSAVVLKTEDALADDELFRNNGLSAGKVLDFERPVIDASGKADVAAFRLAFAADPSSPEPYFFTCQRVRSPDIDRGGLESHRNGTVAIRSIEARSARPDNHAAFLKKLLGVAPNETLHGSVWPLENSAFALTHQAGGNHGGMHLTAIRLGVTELDGTAALFKAEGIAYEVSDRSLIVHPAPGQGTTFIFEAMG